MSFENGHAFTLDVDDSVEDVFPEDGKHFSVEEIYKICDCDTVQRVYVHYAIKPEWVIWMDEDGKPRGKEFNQFATELYRRYGDFVVGKVLVCPKKMVE